MTVHLYQKPFMSFAPTRGCRSCHSGWVEVQSQRPRATSTSPRNTFLPRGSACHTDRFKVRLRSSPTRTLYYKNQNQATHEDMKGRQIQNTLSGPTRSKHLVIYGKDFSRLEKWVTAGHVAGHVESWGTMTDGGFLQRLPLPHICDM